MISLKEIGKICGLAESTVSKALKQAPGIKKETAARVMEVARQYGYQPNAMVECIQTGRSRSIGIAFNKSSASLPERSWREFIRLFTSMNTTRI